MAYGRYPRWRGRGFATRAVIKVEPEDASSSAVARRTRFTLSGQLSEDGAVFDRYFLDLG
ncbi:GNAT family protein [Amycolatopsis echigonensis]|uniref:Uncharacterized protein n=1 Tax=Amycolatopsis echigonensis TaxID=2576905 RepID=A0A8E2B1A9_9PSEU|nr:hypothetical protein [Amycolatopsis echigonensis]MBB2498887.1 hypothetical protein [Amycolatopsis echigonensis]